jgi:hypothetical protein
LMKQGLAETAVQWCCVTAHRIVAQKAQTMVECAAVHRLRKFIWIDRQSGEIVIEGQLQDAHAQRYFHTR